MYVLQLLLIGLVIIKTEKTIMLFALLKTMRIEKQSENKIKGKKYICQTAEFLVTERAITFFLRFFFKKTNK